MGSILLKIFENPREHEDRMIACLRLMKKVFASQLITLAI
jgi:hypothetical protein